MAVKNKETKILKEPVKNKAGSQCPHPAYKVIDGELRCAVCGELSTRAKVVNGQIVRIPPEVTCPECGHKFTAKK